MTLLITEPVYGRDGLYRRAYGGGNLNFWKSDPPSWLMYTNSRSFTENVDWRVRVRKHFDAGANYNLKKLLSSDTVIGFTKTADYREKPTQYTYAVTYWAPTLSAMTHPSELSALRDMANKRIKGKLQGHQPSFAGLTYAAELVEGRHLISQVADTLHRTLVSVGRAGSKLRGSPSSVDLQLGKIFAENWLNFSFAVKPTILTTNELINSVGALIQEGQYFREHGSASDSFFSRGNDLPQQPAAAGQYWRHKCSPRVTHTTSRFTSGAWTRVPGSNTYSLPDHFGLEFGDVIPTLWELTPYSWAFDYFSTVGEFLEDVFQTPSFNTVYLYNSDKSIINFDIEWVREWNEDWAKAGTHSFYGDTQKVQHFQILVFDRTKYTDLPTRSLRFKTLDEIGKNSVNKLLNLSSVLALQGWRKTKFL